MSDKTVYIVPFDFTPVTENALNQALGLSKKTEANIILLHIVKNATDVQSANKRLKDSIKKLGFENDSRIGSQTVVGSIFEQINTTAEEKDASLIVMGTHGAKGLQKVLGSHAIKVIQSSTIPFIITQGKRKSSEVNRIALPIDLSKESTQILRFAVNLAESTKAEIHLLGKHYKDKDVQMRMKSNMIACKKFLEEHRIKWKLSIPEGNKSFNDLILDYSKKHSIDMIAAAYFSDSIIPQFDKFLQLLITNSENIPVMTVSAVESGGIGGSVAY